MDPRILPKRRGEHWIKQELERPVQSWPRPSAQRGDLCESFLGMESRQEAQPGGGCLRGQSWHLSGLGVVSARNDHMCSKPREQKQMKLSFLFLVHHPSMTHHCGLNKPHKLYLKSYLFKWSHVAWAVLTREILLPLPLKHWDYRYGSPDKAHHNPYFDSQTLA